MSDVFVAYARTDSARAEALAVRLSVEGWSVFMDVQLRTGDRWHKVIDLELRAARAIVVLWSKDSVDSDFVLEEADIGKARGVLFPAFVEDVPPPYGFSRLQTVNLVGWNGSDAHPGFKALVNDLRRHLGSVRAPQDSAPVPLRTRKRALTAPQLAALAGVPVAGIVVLLIVSNEPRTHMDSGVAASSAASQATRASSSVESILGFSKNHYYIIDGPFRTKEEANEEVDGIRSKLNGDEVKEKLSLLQVDGAWRITLGPYNGIHSATVERDYLALKHAEILGPMPEASLSDSASSSNTTQKIAAPPAPAPQKRQATPPTARKSAPTAYAPPLSTRELEEWFGGASPAPTDAPTAAPAPAPAPAPASVPASVPAPAPPLELRR